jgi:hypothetical protein
VVRQKGQALPSPRQADNFFLSSSFWAARRCLVPSHVVGKGVQLRLLAAAAGGGGSPKGAGGGAPPPPPLRARNQGERGAGATTGSEA